MNQKIIGLLREHYIGIIFGVVISLLVVLPHILSVALIGSQNFEGVYPTHSDDEIAYQARMQEVLDGNINIGNPYSYERVDDPFIMPPVAEWLVAGVSYISGQPVPKITSIFDAVLAFINFLLIYALFLVVTKGNKWISLLYTFIFFFLSLYVMGRPISPQLNIIPMIIGLILISKLHFESKATNTKKLNVLAGFFVGVTSFFYPYFFSTAVAIWAILVFLKILDSRSFKILQKEVVYFLLGFTLPVSLYAYFQLRAGGEPFYAETVARFGLFQTHIPGSFTNVAFGILTIGIIVLAYRFLSRKDLLYSLSIGASIIALNWQNIITGQSLQFSSHYQLTTLLSSLLVLSIVHMALQTKVDIQFRFKKYVKPLLIIGMFVLVLLYAEYRKSEFINIGATLYSEQEILVLQEKKEVFNWFNENSAVDSVVYSLGSNYDFLIPVYTHNKVYYNFYTALYFASNEELEERWLVQNIFNEDMSTTTILNSQRDFWGNRYIDRYQSNESRRKIMSFIRGEKYVPLNMISANQIEYMWGRWKEISGRSLEEAFSVYDIDYILLSVDYPFFDETRNKLEEIDWISLKEVVGGEYIYSL